MGEMLGDDGAQPFGEGGLGGDQGLLDVLAGVVAGRQEHVVVGVIGARALEDLEVDLLADFGLDGGGSFLGAAVIRVLPRRALSHAGAAKPRGGARARLAAVRLLAVETSTLAGGVALLDGERLRGEYLLDVRITHSERLMPAIDRLLGDAGWAPDLEGLAVAVGPGSFTGLRIGLSAVKGLRWPWAIPVAAMPTLDAMAAALPFAACPCARSSTPARARSTRASTAGTAAPMRREWEYLALAPGRAGGAARRADDPDGRRRAPRPDPACADSPRPTAAAVARPPWPSWGCASLPRGRHRGRRRPDSPLSAAVRGGAQAPCSPSPLSACARPISRRCWPSSGLPSRCRGRAAPSSTSSSRTAWPAATWSARTAVSSAYICLWEVADEVHITNVAVHPDLRRRGVGRALAERVLERCAAAAAATGGAGGAAQQRRGPPALRVIRLSRGGSAPRILLRHRRGRAGHGGFPESPGTGRPRAPGGGNRQRREAVYALEPWMAPELSGRPAEPHRDRRAVARAARSWRPGPWPPSRRPIR